jgi:hypothetical protein
VDEINSARNKALASIGALIGPEFSKGNYQVHFWNPGVSTPFLNLYIPVL